MQVVAAEAEVGKAERGLLNSVFHLGESEVHELMVPRVDIVGIEQSTPRSEVLDRVRSAQHSRVPVFEETVDEIVAHLIASVHLPDHR